ncbi:unnamed protein product [Blepharisma stoltei]|uniref:Uncharacterized protein n=1 Tax=Blepharisma stoltei TaxID=1481888 RepID=A0AAU9K7P2_9CILI|nr:unnamed protein product [Blepharisma stoltei]
MEEIGRTYSPEKKLFWLYNQKLCSIRDRSDSIDSKNDMLSWDQELWWSAWWWKKFFDEDEFGCEDWEDEEIEKEDGEESGLAEKVY